MIEWINEDCPGCGEEPPFNEQVGFCWPDGYCPSCLDEIVWEMKEDARREDY